MIMVLTFVFGGKYGGDAGICFGENLNQLFLLPKNAIGDMLNINLYTENVMKKLLYNTLLPLAFIAIFLWSLIGVSQSRSFYDTQYQKNGTAAYIGIAHNDLMEVTDNLLSYMVEQREDLFMHYEVKGKLREIFDYREKLHMVDVVNLYMGVIRIAAALSAVVLASLAFLIKKDGWSTARKTLNKKYLWSAIGLGVVASAFGIAIITNFDAFWRKFHYVFFTNDLWQLDPKVSIMINMFPLEFFYAMCARILIVFVLGCIAVKFLLMEFRR